MCLSVCFGFLLSERISRVSPIIFHKVHIHAILPYGNSAILPRCRIATRCPWTPQWCLLLPHPDPHHRMTGVGIRHNISRAAVPYAHAALNILNIYCGLTNSGVRRMQQGVRLSHQEQKWEAQVCSRKQDSGILEQGRRAVGNTTD